MFLWVLFLHNYIIPQKRLLPCFFRDAAFSFVFYSAFLYGISNLHRAVMVNQACCFGEINYNLAASVPLTATPNRESRAEPLSPLGETSAQSADTPCESTATLRAGAQSNVQKALKGCGGKQEFSPTSNILTTKVPFLKNSPVDCF